MVYCRNCKWWEPIEDDRREPFDIFDAISQKIRNGLNFHCTNSKHIIEHDSPMSHWQECGDCFKINKNNDCKEYEEYVDEESDVRAV